MRIFPDLKGFIEFCGNRGKIKEASGYYGAPNPIESHFATLKGENPWMIKR